MKKAPPFFATGTALVATLLLLPLNALAQNAGGQNSAANAATSPPKCEPRDPKDARPNDLRAALLQQRQKCDVTADAGPSGRHLSTQEKAQLREQLRQQR